MPACRWCARFATAGTGETESVPAGSCVAVSDEHMEMIEMDADLEDTDYPLVDFSLPVPPSGGCSGAHDGHDELGLANQTLAYPTEFAPHAIGAVSHILSSRWTCVFSAATWRFRQPPSLRIA